MRHLAKVAFVVALFLPAIAADKKKMGTMFTRPNQEVEIADAPGKAATAAKPCANYAWAANVETTLRAQDFPWKQEDLAVKIGGGMKCMSTVDYAESTKYITGDYMARPNERRHIEATWVAGPPRYPDALIVSLRDGHPMIMVWRGKPYLVYGLVFDAYLTPSTKENIFYIKELRLIDSTIAPDKPERKVVFVRERDDANEIDGMLWLKVTTPE